MALLALYNFNSSASNFVRKVTYREIIHKISESNSIPVTPSNSANLPHVLTGHRQGKPIPPNLWAYNLSYTYPNAMKLVGNENSSINFNMIQVSYKSNLIPIFGEFLLFSV